MYTNNYKYPFLNNFSSARNVLNIMEDMNQREGSKLTKHLLTKPTARFGGVLLGTIATLFDLCIHTGCFAGKATTGIVVSPYNYFAKNKFSKDFELSSAFNHATIIGKLFVNLIIAPFVTIYSPESAASLYQFTPPKKNTPPTHEIPRPDIADADTTEDESSSIDVSKVVIPPEPAKKQKAAPANPNIDVAQPDPTPVLRQRRPGKPKDTPSETPQLIFQPINTTSINDELAREYIADSLILNL